METSEIVKKHEKRFNRIRIMIKLLLVIVFGLIACLQADNIIRIFNWLFKSN